MQKIWLTGKHAVGQHAYALVDDEDYAELSKYRWKAKPNGAGKHVYAVRNATLKNGKSVMIRMHRAVLGYSGSLDVDHINRDTVDNRKANLRIVTRSVNVRNTQHRLGVGLHSVWPRRPEPPAPIAVCARCAIEFEPSKQSQQFCSEPCRKRAKYRRQKATRCLPPSKRMPSYQAA